MLCAYTRGDRSQVLQASFAEAQAGILVVARDSVTGTVVAYLFSCIQRTGAQSWEREASVYFPRCALLPSTCLTRRQRMLRYFPGTVGPLVGGNHTAALATIAKLGSLPGE